MTNKMIFLSIALSFDTERRNKYNKFMMNKYLAEVEKNNGERSLNNRSSFEIEKSIENEFNI